MPYALPSSSVTGSLTGEGQCPEQSPWSWVGHLSGLLRSDPEQGPPWAEAEPGPLARGASVPQTPVTQHPSWTPGRSHLQPLLLEAAPGGGGDTSRDHVTSGDVLLAHTGQPASPSASTH